MSPQIIILFVIFISLFCKSHQEECTQVLECSWWQSIIEGCPKPIPCITATEISTESEESTTEYVEPTTTQPSTTTTTTETAKTTLLVEAPTVDSETTARYNGSDSNLGTPNNAEGHMKCYQCSSTQKGCTTDWRKLTFLTCPLTDDKCVKIIHTHGNDDVIMRNCLSLVHGAPDDNSKGCRTVARNESLDYNDNNTTNMGNVTWCFCQRDFCNDSSRLQMYFKFSYMIALTVFFFMSI